MSKQSEFQEQVVIEKGNWLCCPSCGDNVLHQQAIDVFFRREGYSESHGVGIVPKEKGLLRGTMDIKSPFMSNPSDKRDGINILFTCENCTHPLRDAHCFVLTLSQDHGRTIMKWSTFVVKNPFEREETPFDYLDDPLP